MESTLKEIDELHSFLENHPVYSSISSINSLKIFMQYHVFAVWDFMSLLKSLQKEVTCVTVPWTPSKYSKEIVRMVNEIVLGEESDVDPQGRACDHFSLYLDSMKEVGACTEEIQNFLVDFELEKLPMQVRKFVSFNLDLALSNDPHKVAAAFFFGREKLIPDMFTGILKHLKSKNHSCPKLIYYIERHIELDGDEHSILAKKCLEELCSGDSDKLEESYEVGKRSLELRIELWDGVLNEIKREEELLTLS